MVAHPTRATRQTHTDPHIVDLLRTILSERASVGAPNSIQNASTARGELLHFCFTRAAMAFLPYG